MKIPNKVYIPYEIMPDYISDHYYLGPTPKMENAEYIRKDALMEWAKEKYNEYKQMDEDFQGDVFLGNRHALAEVIQKIESL